MEAEAHRQLACSAYVSPSKVYSVRGHEGRMVPLTMWLVRDLQSEFAEACPDDGWRVWDPHISNLEAGLPAEDLGMHMPVALRLQRCDRQRLSQEHLKQYELTTNARSKSAALRKPHTHPNSGPSSWP
jgi:hypothetical protein